MAAKKRTKKEVTTEIPMITLCNLKNMVVNISYVLEDGSIATLNIKPMGSVIISATYKEQIIKFINNGLIKIK